MKVIYKIALSIRHLFDWVFSMFDALFNKHKLMRRGVIFSFGWLMYHVLTFMLPKLSAGQLMIVFSEIIGFFGVVTGFYIYLRNKDQD